jgi:hypothetical protein
VSTIRFATAAADLLDALLVTSDAAEAHAAASAGRAPRWSGN